MRYRIVLLTLLLAALFINGWAVEKSGSLEEYRDEGSKRIYQITINETPIGSLESVFEGDSKFENSPVYRFTEKLDLDFTSLGQSYSLQIDNKHYVDENGFYAGDDMTLIMGGQSQQLYLSKTDDSLLGYYVTNQPRQDVAQPMPGRIFSADNNMFGQYEMFLAFKDFELGDTISDTVFVPQAMMTAEVQIVIEDFGYVKYGELYDSAYACHYYKPSEMIAYFTRDKKLIRLDQTAQNLRAILSESPLDKAAPKKQPFGIRDFIKRIPLYLVYLILGIIFSSAFIWRYHKKPLIYIALILGGVVFPVLSVTQFPLQKWYSLTYLIPHVQGGGSLYLYGIVLPLLSGLIQETLKLIPIALIFFWRRPKQLYSVAVGLFCGLGFGLYEACSLTGADYQTGMMTIFSWGVLGQIFSIIFHMTSGAAMGYGLNRGFGYLTRIWIVVVLVHTLSKYLLVFLQEGVIDIGVFEFLVAIIDLLLLLGVYLLIKNARR